MITEITDHNTQPAITVYTKPDCMGCRATFRWLDKRGITYTAVDITQDLTAYEYIKELGYLAAPVVVTSSGDHWSGFDPVNLEKVIS